MVSDFIRGSRIFGYFRKSLFLNDLLTDTLLKDWSNIFLSLRIYSYRQAYRSVAALGLRSYPGRPNRERGQGLTQGRSPRSEVRASRNGRRVRRSAPLTPPGSYSRPRGGEVLYSPAPSVWGDPQAGDGNPKGGVRVCKE
ncbi:hypothetical protein D3C80_1569600 [compost metagenome]